MSVNTSRLGDKKNKKQERLGKKLIDKQVLGVKKSTKSPKKRAYDQMNKDEQEDAIFTNASYDAPETRKDIGDYKYDKDLSDLRTAVYHNPKTKHTKMSLRGTDFKNVKDVATDVGILTGKQKNTSMFKKDKKDFKKVVSKYGKNIKLHGHSLGGSRAYQLSKDNNVEASVFNMGTGIDKGGMFDKLKCSNPIKTMRPKWCDKIKKHHVFGDGISATGKLTAGDQKTYFTGDYNPAKTHTMANFLKDN